MKRLAAFEELRFTGLEHYLSAGIVEDLPAEWLPMYQNREPMVIVLPPNGHQPYTLIRWHEARDIYPLPE
jgi:hypothetical protein